MAEHQHLQPAVQAHDFTGCVSDQASLELRPRIFQMVDRDEQRSPVVQLVDALELLDGVFDRVPSVVFMKGVVARMLIGADQ